MSSLTFFAVVLVAFGANLANAQVLSVGTCNKDINAMTGFTPPAYLGRWYEIKRFFAIFELGADCVTADYSLNDDNSIKVVNSQINSLTGKESNVVGKATFVENNTVGNLAVQFSSSPVPGSYMVLDTDYDSFSLVYSCTNILVSKAEFAWCLTREANPPAAVVEKCIAAAKKNGIDVNKFSNTNQDKCTYPAPA